jgi:WD40 repeat protein
LLVSGRESRSSDTTVNSIWDVPKGTCSYIIYGHIKVVTSVASFQDLVASGSDDELVNIYDLGSCHVVQTISPHIAVRSSDSIPK